MFSKSTQSIAYGSFESEPSYFRQHWFAWNDGMVFMMWVHAVCPDARLQWSCTVRWSRASRGPSEPPPAGSFSFQVSVTECLNTFYCCWMSHKPHFELCHSWVNTLTNPTFRYTTAMGVTPSQTPHSTLQGHNLTNPTFYPIESHFQEPHNQLHYPCGHTLTE